MSSSVSSQLDAFTSKLLKRDFWVGLLQGGSGAENSKRFTLEELRLRCETLERNPIVTDANRAVVVQTLRTVAEFMIWGDQNAPQFFDFFMSEYNVLAYLQRILQQPHNRMGEMAQQLLQTLAIIAQNMGSERGLWYLFSFNHVNSIVETPFDFEDEEVLGFYISFLKAVSLKLNPNTIKLLLQQQNPADGGMATRATQQQQQQQRYELPLYSEGIKFAHHKESLVRAGVRTLTLNVYAVHDATVCRIVTSPPATSYLSSVCTYMGELTQVLAQELGACVEGFSQQALSALDSPLAEMEDMLSYCSDVLATAHVSVADTFARQLWHGFVVPYLLTPLAAFPQGLDGTSSAPMASLASAAPYAMCLYTLERCFCLLVHAPLLSNLALALLGCPAAAGTHYVLLPSCRHSLAQALQAHQPFCGAGAVRLLSAVRVCRHLGADVRAALGLPGGATQPPLAAQGRMWPAAGQRPYCWCFLGAAGGDGASLLLDQAVEPLSCPVPQWRYWPVWDPPPSSSSSGGGAPGPAPALQPLPSQALAPAAPPALALEVPDLLIQLSEDNEQSSHTIQPSKQPQQQQLQQQEGDVSGSQALAGGLAGGASAWVASEVEAVLGELVAQAVGFALQQAPSPSPTEQPPQEPQQHPSPVPVPLPLPEQPPECQACLGRTVPPHLGDDFLASLLVLLGNPRTSMLAHALAGHLLVHLSPQQQQLQQSHHLQLSPSHHGGGGADHAAAEPGAAHAAVGRPGLEPEHRQLLASALTKAATHVGEQLEHCWPDAFFPIFHHEYQQQRRQLFADAPGGAGGRALLQASADQLVSGELSRCADAHALEALGLGTTAVHALELCHAVQHFVAVLLVCQACDVFEAQAQPGSVAWMLSEMEQPWTEVLEGQQVMLSKANSISCQVCFVPPDPIRVSLAVAGDASDAVMLSSSSLAAASQMSPRRAAATKLAYGGMLTHSSPSVVLAQCANNCVDAGIVVSTAPLLGSRFYQDPKVAVWMHVLVRPSVQSLVKQVRKAALRKGGLLSCLRNLADGHWILQFKDGLRVLEGLRLVEGAVGAAGDVYKEVVGRQFVNGWISALYTEADGAATAL